MSRFRSCSRNLSFIALLACCAIGAAQNAPAPSRARTFYIDCSAPTSGDGASQQTPWNNLAQLNAVTFSPGDTIRLRRGISCNGVLAPKGSGTDGSPIRLTAYGEGPRPKIIAGASPEEALKLFNQQYWDIDSLDISGGETYGVFISGDKGILHHIHLFNLAVHDVFGGEMKHKESGLVSISPGSANQHFDDVLVDNVTAWNTNQWVGILIGGGDIGYPPESDWSSNVIIRNSAIHDVQGDGIVLFRDRNGEIANSVAWYTGMQNTESIGTPNAIWTWMCDDCVVRGNEAYLTDSPGVDGGAYDIDYGNTKNSVIDNYAHDTQGYCVAVFGAGFVTKQSLVRGNLCINNARSPRMAQYQSAIFVLTWNGGSIDGLTVEDNTVYWNPYKNAPPLLNEADIKANTALFRNNTIYSTAPWMTDSNTSMAFEQNRYSYFGTGNPEWRYGSQQFGSLRAMQNAVHQETGSTFARHPLQQWSSIFKQHDGPLTAPGTQGWQLTSVVPVSLNADGLIDDSALQQIVVLKSFAQQYRAQGLRVSLRLASSGSRLFSAKAFRNAITDLDLGSITVEKASGAAPEETTLSTPGGKIAVHFSGFASPTQLGLALRRAFGEPIYSQMENEGK